MHEIPLQRVAAIHDLSGFGRASLTVVIPILASMGVQTCPLPTAVLSSQTSGVEGFTFHDLTAEMGPMLDHWQRMGLSFDAVYSGFLGNPLQLEIAARCIGHFLKPGGFALVDPVLGDNGTLDPTQTPEMVEAMRQLIGHAHVITPNLTEAAFLLDEPYRPDISPDGLKEQLRRLAAMGPDRVVITSAPATRPGHCAAVAYDREQGRFWKMESPYIPAFYPGTGDTFSSVLVGAFLQGDSLPVALERAVRFVTLGILQRAGGGVPSGGQPARGPGARGALRDPGHPRHLRLRHPPQRRRAAGAHPARVAGPLRHRGVRGVLGHCSGSGRTQDAPDAGIVAGYGLAARCDMKRLFLSLYHRDDPCCGRRTCCAGGPVGAGQRGPAVRIKALGAAIRGDIL